jgi:signal transduction histidine kinase
MSTPSSVRPPLSRARRRALILGTAGFIFLIGAAFLAAAASRTLAQRWVEHTHVALRTVDRALAGLVNAETAQRGFLVTGHTSYLEPYHAGLAGYERAVAQLRTLTADNPVQRRRLDSLDALAARKRAELDSTILLRGTEGPEAAAAIVNTGRGKEVMDSIRLVAGRVQQEEVELLRLREARESSSNRLTLAIAVVGTVAAVALVLLLGSLLSSSAARQEQLLKQLADAQRLEAVGRLAGGMAHELNNRLTASIGFARFALDELPAGHPATLEIGQSLKSQERAARITSEVLSFSGRQILAPTEFAVHDALREMEPLLRRSLGPEQRLELVLGDDAGSVTADRARLDQVLLNLTLNARDAMGEGGALTVRTCVERATEGGLRGPEGEALPAGAYVAVVFEDTGCGMSAETRRRAIEPFFTTKPTGRGTGLGLSMVYGFVRQSGGTLRIASEPGNGTVVTLYLPVNVPPPSPSAPPAAS